MRIAVLVWGSLYWDPRNLKTSGEWLHDGPSFPIEFARISKENRLTLVIKPGFNCTTTLYTISAHENLGEARENLREREGTTNINNIGFLDCTNSSQQVRDSNAFVIDILQQWNEDKKFDAIIWSDFSPRFTDAIHKAFTLENVISFLKGLPDNEKQTALQYIKNAPLQIATRFRNSIQEHFKV